MRLGRALLPTVFAACILGASGPWGSADVTVAVAKPWLMMLGLDAATAECVHAALRKIGHFTVYGAFAWVVLRSLRGPRRATPALALVAWLVAVGLASLDEGLQSLSKERGASPWDVLLDVAGAAAFLLFVLRRSRREPCDEEGS